MLVSGFCLGYKWSGDRSMNPDDYERQRYRSSHDDDNDTEKDD